MKKITAVLSFLFVIGISLISNLKATTTFKTINIAGIVIDSKTMQPVSNATIFDEKNNKVASTDNKGYFNTKLNYPDNGKIGFNFKIEKEGYQSFVQRENWGDVRATNTVYYFGLQQNGIDNGAFSEMSSSKNDISYAAISPGLKDVMEKLKFRDKIDVAKKGNDNTFFEIDGSFYLINNFGWIKLKSKEDKVIINKNETVPAFELNKKIKRKDVKRMTPSESGENIFEIYTK